MIRTLFVVVAILSQFSLAHARGSKPPCLEDSDYLRPFDSALVAAQARHAHQVLRRTTFMAETIRSGPSPGFGRYYTINSLTKITRQVPWIYLKIEEHPENARCKSQFSADFIALELVWLRNSYLGANFHPNVRAAIENSVEVLTEILLHYEKVESDRNLSH